MAEVQSSQQSGEMTRRFIEFVLMQAQQIALMLGQIPGPDGKPMEPNLPVAKVFIDQLDMIREKTRGNLSKDEEELLAKVLADLQLAFVEAGQGTPAAAAPPAPDSVPASGNPWDNVPVEVVEIGPEGPFGIALPAEGKIDDDGKKKFTKSYG